MSEEETHEKMRLNKQAMWETGSWYFKVLRLELKNMPPTAHLFQIESGVYTTSGENSGKKPVLKNFWEIWPLCFCGQ